MKYLVTFEKGESARWLGHLDILRTFERAIRRADLPIAFSGGFNPREKLAFASALSVGVTAGEEPLTIELTTPIASEDLIQRLNLKLPPGIQLRSAREIPDLGFRDLLNSFDRGDFTVTCVAPESPNREELENAVAALLAREELPVEREREGKIKRVNIRPFVHGVRVEAVSEDRVKFGMTLAIGNDGTAKPQEVVAMLAERFPGLAVRRVHRDRLVAREETETPVAA